MGRIPMRYFGKIGYHVSTETAPGVWRNVMTEREYYGDVLKNASQWSKGDGANDDRTINNRISIVADPFMYEHCHAIKYISWMGARWRVSSIEIQRPRIILGVGGVWDEE